MSDLKWAREYAKFGDIVSPGMDIKSFEMEELVKARSWAVDA